MTPDPTEAPTVSIAREAAIMTQLQAIAASVGEVRERLAGIEGLRADIGRHESILVGLDARTRSLEVATGQVSVRVASLLAGATGLLGVVLSWAVGRVLGGP